MKKYLNYERLKRVKFCKNLSQTTQFDEEFPKKKKSNILRQLHQRA